MEKITLAQAFKLKNKKVANISKYDGIIRKWNSIDEKNAETRPYNVREILQNYIQEKNDLVALKTAIHKASEPVRELIFRQGELKSFINFLKGIDTSEGIRRNSYSGGEYNVTAVFKEEEINSMIGGIEEEIEKIQEELDRFNHKKYIAL